MRNTFLACYDICDDKRLRTAYKTMRDFGDHLQYSIFECQFTPSDLVRGGRCPRWPRAAPADCPDRAQPTSDVARVAGGIEDAQHRKVRGVGGLGNDADLRLWTAPHGGGFYAAPRHPANSRTEAPWARASI